MCATIYLFRHGKIQKTDPFDSLNSEGENFRDWLPRFFKERGTQLKAAYFDESDGIKRCAATLAAIQCEKTGYGTGKEKPFKTLNAVLGELTDGDHALCCRGDSIESGQLYHVENFEAHTPFYTHCGHGAQAKQKTGEAYHMVYVLKLLGNVWRQIEKIPLHQMPAPQ